jgi:multidrug efflux system outer membrane protein
VHLTTRGVGVTLLLTVVTACRMGPNYQRPETTPVATAWRDSAQAGRDSSFANVPWWGVFNDDTLQTLIRRALKENRDVHIALARVNEARALLGMQRLEYYPQINVQAAWRKSDGADSLLTGVTNKEMAWLGGGLSWELDLWGRLRRLNEAAAAELLATEEGRRSMILTVVGDVARAYMELIELDNQVALTDTQMVIRQQSLQVARGRFQGGLTSEMDVRQGELALAVAEGSHARALRQRTQKENEISVLLGRTPGGIPRGLRLSQQGVPTAIPAGLPSNLLTRRPDVRQAEEQLRAANARIGAAKAAMFPTISLTATGGTVSDELGSLFDNGTGFWRLAPNLFQPIINTSRNRKQIAAERARTEAAVGQYEKTVLTAFREVEDQLVAVQRLREEADAAGRASTAARQGVRLAGLRYEGGVDNYLNLLDAQRAQLDADLQASGLERQYRVAVVQLYKALGGGWDPVTDTLAMPTRKSGR